MTDRVAIVGARDASPETLERVREYVRGLPEGTIVVSGGAKGVDEAAAAEARRRGRSAEERGLRVFEYFARREYGETWIECNGEHCLGLGGESVRDALLLRNTLIAIRCTRMVAFVEGSKGGTWDAIAQGRRFKRPVKVIK
jgi:hypothetical protein